MAATRFFGQFEYAFWSGRLGRENSNRSFSRRKTNPPFYERQLTHLRYLAHDVLSFTFCIAAVGVEKKVWCLVVVLEARSERSGCLVARHLVAFTRTIPAQTANSALPKLSHTHNIS